MADIRALGRIQRRFKDIRGAIENFITNPTLQEVKLNLRLLNDEWKDFCQLEKSIASNTANEKILTDIEDQYYELKKKLITAEETCMEDNDPDSNTSMNNLLENQRTFLKEMSNLHKSDDFRLP